MKTTFLRVSISTLALILLAAISAFSQAYTGLSFRAKATDTTAFNFPAGYGGMTYFNGRLWLKDAAGWFQPRRVTPALPSNNFVFGTGAGIGVSSSTYSGNDNVLVVMTQSPPTITDPSNFINNVFVFGESITLKGDPPAGGSITDTGIFGIGHIVGDGINYFGGSSSLVYGAHNHAYGNSGLIGGYAAELQHSGEPNGFFYTQGGVAIGLTSTTRDNTKWVTAAANAINISQNTSAQTAGHGALGSLSFIIGGEDGDISATSPRSGILGGSGIVARASDPDQIYVPNFNIVSTPLNDNALTQILARDGTTGQIKYRTAASILGGPYVDLATDQTIGGRKTFTIGPLINQQSLSTTNIIPALQINVGNHIGAASTTYRGIYVNMSSWQWGTGSLSNQYFVDLSGIQMNFTGASIASDAAILHVGVPTAGANATLSNPWSIRADGPIYSIGTSFLTGGLVVGTNPLSSGALVDFQSTTLGFSPPKMNTTQRDAIVSPSDGLIIANTQTHTLDWYNGTAWAVFGTGSFVDLTTNQTGIAGNKSWTGKHLFGSSGLAASFGSSAALTQIGTEIIQVKVDQNSATAIGINNATNNTASSAEILLKTGSASFSSTGLRIGNFAPNFTSSSQFQAGQSTIHDYGNGLNLSGVGGVNFYTANNYRGKVSGGGVWLFGGNATTALGSEAILIRVDGNSSTLGAVVNATSGTAANASFVVRAGANNLNDFLQVVSNSPAYTSSGMLEASKGAISSLNLSGLNVGTAIASPLQFWTNNTLRGQFNSSGVFIIGTGSATAGSVLADFQSTTLGVLMPRVTNAASIATPVNGMIAYDAATNKFNFRENATWVQINTGGIGGSTGSTDRAVLIANGTGGSAVQSSNTTTVASDGSISTGVTDDGVNINVAASTSSIQAVRKTTSSTAVGFTIKAQSGVASGTTTGGLTTISGGDGITNGNGGNVKLAPGLGAGTGVIGKVELGNAGNPVTIDANGPLRLKSYTVATLPASPVQGMTAFVTDALGPTYLVTIVGGGSVVTPVFFNGTNWVAY